MQMEEGTWYCVMDGRTGRRKNMLSSHQAIEPGCENGTVKLQRPSVEIPPINSSLQPAYSITVRLSASF